MFPCFQPEGLRYLHSEGGAAGLSGTPSADSFLALSGGLRFAPTTGYYLSAFQAEDYYTCWFSTMAQKEFALLERCLISFIAYFEVLREMNGETKESELLKMLGKNSLPQRGIRR